MKKLFLSLIFLVAINISYAQFPIINETQIAQIKSLRFIVELDADELVGNKEVKYTPEYIEMYKTRIAAQNALLKQIVTDYWFFTDIQPEFMTPYEIWETDSTGKSVVILRLGALKEAG